jgi:hypothetical protein
MRAALRRAQQVIALVALLVAMAPGVAAVASGDPMAAQPAPGTGLQEQVQIPVPHIDFDPTQWVQDGFSALLQSFTDGIRTGMEAIWTANFITQTPPSLTYQNGDIRALHETMRAAANAALVLIASIGGLNSILRPHLGLRYHSVSAFVPRWWSAPFSSTRRCGGFSSRSTSTTRWRRVSAMRRRLTGTP